MDRDITTHEVDARWREMTGPDPDAVELLFGSVAFSAGEPINLEIYGTDVIVELTQASAMAKTFLASFAGVSDIADSFRSG